MARKKAEESVLIDEYDWMRFKELLSYLKLGYGEFKYEKGGNQYKVTDGATTSNIRKIKKMIRNEKANQAKKKQLTFFI